MAKNTGWVYNEANERGSILLSNCSFWFNLLSEKVTQQSPTVGRVAPPLRTIELPSRRPSGFATDVLFLEMLLGVVLQ